jgi:hypothetical protein
MNFAGLLRIVAMNKVPGPGVLAKNKKTYPLEKAINK